MFKNAKLLKSVTVVLACALVLFLGIYYVGAADSTVILYVSDHGDNTTGIDEASAYTSILDATKAANEMKLKPGTKLKLLLVDRVTVTTETLNVPVYDTEGNEITVLAEGYGFDGDVGNRADVYCTWYNSSQKSYRQWLLLGGNMEFHGVRFLSKLQDQTYGSGVAGHYCTRYFYASGHYATFDNVEFTTEAPEDIKWTLRADKYSSSNVLVKTAGHSGFALKNGDYTNCTLVVSGYAVSNYDLDVSFENAKVAAFSILSSSSNKVDNPFLDQKANSITVTFGSGTVVEKNKDDISLYTNSSDGYYEVPGGITVNFMEGCEIQGTITPVSKVKTTTVTCDHSFNYYGGTFKSHVYSGFSGIVPGKLANNISGGEFLGYFRGSGGVSDTQQNGTITNNVSGGTFESYQGVAHMAMHKDVINNISGGTFDSYYGLSLASGATSVTNNITGGTFKGSYHGAGSGGRGETTKLVTNNISGGEFLATTYLGRSCYNGYSGAVEKVVNNIKNITFGNSASDVLYCGGGSYVKKTSVKDADGNYIYLVKNEETGNWERSPENAKTDYNYATYKVTLSNVDEVINNFENCTIVGQFYGGASAGECDTIVNNIKNCTFKSYFYGGNGAGTSRTVYTEIEQYKVYSAVTETFLPTTTTVTNNITNSVLGDGERPLMGSAAGKLGALTNNFNKVTVNDRIWMGSAGGDVGIITNNIKDSNLQGTTYSYYGASRKGTYEGVYNNITNTEFRASVNMAGGYTTGQEIECNFVTNTLEDCVFNSSFYGGALVGEVNGDITTNFNNGNTIKGRVCLSSAGGAVAGNVIGNFNGDTTFNGDVYGGGAYYKDKMTGAKKIELNVDNGIFNKNIYGGSPAEEEVDNVIVITLAGGEFVGNVYGAGLGACEEENVTIDIKPDESAQALTFKGAVSSAKDKAIVTIHGANKPINLTEKTMIYADAIEDERNIIFCQIATWKTKVSYVSLPIDTDVTNIKAVNKDSTLTTGKAVFRNSAGRKVLVSARGLSLSFENAPKLSGYSFVLDNTLKVRFFIPLSQIQFFLDELGEWDYSVMLGGTELVNGGFASVADIPAEAVVLDKNGVNCFTFVTNLGIAAADYDQKIVVSWSGNEEAFSKSVFELLEGGIETDNADAKIVELLKAMYNYGTEAENVFENKETALKYPEIVPTGSYTGASSRTSAEDGFEFFATSLSLEDEVSLNFYLKLASGVSANQMLFTAKNAAGTKTVDASRINVKPVEGVSEYNVIVSVKLSITEMADTYTLTAALADGTAVATCTNSIAYSCADYIATENKFASVSKALLAYIEKAVTLA